MISFKNDYSEGACPQIMEAMNTSNLIQTDGYGLDDICEEARMRIKEKFQCPTSDVHFLVGGTQANLTIIGSALRPFEAVIAVDSGHINVHETGAIEATGHKVIIAEGIEGKITPAGIHKVIETHTDEHMVKPAMVYISNATEIGTVYTKQELADIRKICDKYALYLFMDGARLGSALMAEDNDVKLVDLATYCDVFYIGGTKNGALFGEAVIIVNDKLKDDFRYMIKQRGGMLAKGRLLGIQFNELMKDDVFLDLAGHANKMAQKIQSVCIEMGCEMFVKTTTNQIFPIMDNDILEELNRTYAYQVWEKTSEVKTAVRFVTSWATKEEHVNQFIQDLRKLYKQRDIYA